MRIPRIVRAASVGAAIMTMALSSAVSAATVVVTPPLNSQGWNTADTRPGGTVEFVADADAPGGGEGALQLTTDTNAAKAQYLHAAKSPIGDVDELSYWTKYVSGPVHAAASYQLIVDLNGSAEGGFTTFVFEPYQNGVVDVTGNWQEWDVAAGQLWSSRDFTDGSCVVVAGGGGAPFYSLTTIQSLCPDAVVIGFGVNIGTNNAGYVVRTDLINFDGSVYDFELTNEPENEDDCKDGGWMELTDDDGDPFKNQGQCIKHANGAGGGDE